MTQLIWDAENLYPRNEYDHQWTNNRLGDEFFLCLCLDKKYYQQARELMFKIPLTEQSPKTDKEALPFKINFSDLSPKLQDEFREYCKQYNKRHITIFLKQVVIRLFQNLDFAYAHISVMKKLPSSASLMVEVEDLFGEILGDIDNTDIQNAYDEAGKNKTKSKSKNKTKVNGATNKKVPIKKYSQNGKGRLHECVVIGEKSTFVFLDNDKRPQFVDEIPRLNDILIPDDTIDTQNPIPFIFDSKEELQKCLEEASEETLDSLFCKVESMNRKYVDVEDHYHVLFVASMIWTWLQDKFGYTHYIIIVGDNGSGKNSELLVFRYLGYRVFYVVSASAANYYTKMGNVEEGQITIAEDEAEDIAKNREKRNVWKSGYCSGGTVPKVELEGGRKSEDWLTYAQKWAVMEELSIHKEMKGILDRSFVFKFMAGDPRYNIKDVIKSAGDPKFKPLYDELIKTRKILFCWRMLHYDDSILDVDLNVKNRTAELTKPLIKLFQNSPIALQRILFSLTKFMIERNEIKKNSFESKLYEVIDKLKEERKERLESEIATNDEKTLGELTFTNLALMNMAKEIMECAETEKPNIFWSQEVGTTVSQTKITSVAKSKFKAKPWPKKIDGKTVRCLIFEEQYLKRIKSNYDTPEKIEIITKTEKVTLVTPVTLSTGILPFYSDILNAKIAAISQNLFENSSKIDDNYANKVDDSSPK